jgi:hypothetical protein
MSYIITQIRFKIFCNVLPLLATTHPVPELSLSVKRERACVHECVCCAHAQASACVYKYLRSVGRGSVGGNLLKPVNGQVVGAAPEAICATRHGLP